MSSLYDHLHKLIVKQVDLKMAWIQAGVGDNLVNKGSLSPQSVLDQHGNLTMIDPLKTYEDLWRSTGFRNPFYFPWTTFHSSDITYLIDVIDVLEELEFFWFCDDITKGSALFIEFRAYLDLLRGLLAMAT